MAVDADLSGAGYPDTATRAGVRQPPRNRLVGALVVVPAGGLATLAWLGQAHHWGVTPLAIGVFVVQLVLALAWIAALDTRGGLGAFVIGGLAAAITDAFIAAYPHEGLRVMAAVAGLGIVAALLQQLLRRPRPEVVNALAASTSLILLELAAASPLALRAVISRSGYAVAAGMFGVAAAAVVARALDVVVRRPAAAPASSRGALGIVAGVVAAGAVGALWADHFRLAVPGVWIGVRIAVVAAVLGLIGDLTVDVAAAADLEDRPRSALVPLTLLLPVVLAGPAIYVAARYLLG